MTSQNIPLCFSVKKSGTLRKRIFLQNIMHNLKFLNKYRCNFNNIMPQFILYTCIATYRSLCLQRHKTVKTSDFTP